MEQGPATRGHAAPEPGHQRFGRLQGLRRRIGPLLLGVLIACTILFISNIIKPDETKVTRRLIDEAVRQALASVTPTPPAAARIYEAVRPSLVQIEARTVRDDGRMERGQGSGVVLDENGTLITSYHVVEGAQEIQVTFADGSRSPASIAAVQPENDIAVLRPTQPPAQLVPAVMGNPRSLRVGDDAIVIGNPFGLTGSLTTGTISGLGRSFLPPNRSQPLIGLIQFDAAINPGNSGGPLLNRDGEVVGIVTGLVNPTGQDVFIGIGFAVPIDVAAAAVGPPPF